MPGSLPYISPEEMATWPPPNHVNPTTRRPLVLGVQTPLLVLLILFTAMRFYSKAILIKILGGDDWTMLAASILAVGWLVMTMLSTGEKYQTGYHIWDSTVDPVTNPAPLQIALASQLLFIPIIALAKVSILLVYLRIFPSKRTTMFCYVMLAFTGGWVVVSFSITLLQCKPIQAWWRPFHYSDSVCISPRIVHYLPSCTNMFTDFLIFLWPVKDIAKIQISLRQRVILIAMFGVGIIICIASVCRIWYVGVLVNSYDSSWHGATIYVIQSIEISGSIVCGSLPACKPIPSKLFPRFIKSTTGSAYKTRSTKKTHMKDEPSFALQSLDRGLIVETDDVTMESNKSSPATPQVNIENDEHSHIDTRSAGSEDWIMTPSTSGGGAAGPRRQGPGDYAEGDSPASAGIAARACYRV